jgi:hypothetical protein
VVQRYDVNRKETPFKVGDMVVHKRKVLSSKGKRCFGKVSA